jgi:hypothetical protein
MKRASRQSIRDSKEAAKQCQTAAQFLDDLAGHAHTDEEKQHCLAVAKDLRSAAHGMSRKSKRRKTKPSR